MKRTMVSLFAATLLAAPIVSSAAPILFNMTGTFGSGSTLGGTITIDTSTGLATAANITIGSPASLAFNVVEAQAAIGPTTYQIQIGDGGGLPDFNVIFPVASLIGYAGGSVCSSTSFADCISISDIFYSATNIDNLRIGSASVSVPEPATLALLGLGLFSLALMRRRMH